MSSTNRGATRQPNDFYPTPAWCVKALLATVELPKGCWLEPAVGDGAIIKAVNEIRRNEIDWFANDVETRWLNDPNVQYYNYRYDAEGLGGGCLFDVVITNPPYGQAMEFVKGAMVDGKIVVMLLRLAFLETKVRNKFLQEHPPSVYVLPKRPAFGPNAKHIREGKLDAKDTDSCAYAWFVWGMDSTPKIVVIDWNLCKA